jgi:dUTP pyrophosphatase
MSNVLKFKRLTPNSTELFHASKHDAGFDLSSAYDYVVPSKGKELVKTDIAIELPEGTYGRIASRSSLAWNNFVLIAGGVIDPGYRGNICIILYNFNNEDLIIKKGERIAQLICEKFKSPILEETDELNSTERNLNCFGSTGI